MSARQESREVFKAAQERGTLRYIEKPQTGLIGLVPGEQLGEWGDVVAKAAAFDRLNDPDRFLIIPREEFDRHRG
jgi:hypothetical protein